jgi:hypothetical protein
MHDHRPRNLRTPLPSGRLHAEAADIFLMDGEG